MSVFLCVDGVVRYVRFTVKQVSFRNAKLLTVYVALKLYK